MTATNMLDAHVDHIFKGLVDIYIFKSSNIIGS